MLLTLTTTATSQPTGSSGSNKNVLYYNPVNITSESCVMIDISKNILSPTYIEYGKARKKNEILGKAFFSGHAQVVYCQEVSFFLHIHL